MKPALFVVPLIALGACDSDTASVDAAAIDAIAVDAAPPIDAPPPIDATTAARITATVRYAGTAQGSLIVAAFRSMPPMGPPAGFAMAAQPVFPATLSIDNLDAGPAFALAILDVAPASPQQPGPEDRLVWSSALTLVVGQTTTVTLMLVDPS
jgi:hypothetical protein